MQGVQVTALCILSAAVLVAGDLDLSILLNDTVTATTDGSLTVYVVRVPLPAGRLRPGDFIAACATYDLKPVCSGGRSCKFADDKCVALQVENNLCDTPLQGLTQTIPGGLGPSTCAYITQGQGYDHGWCYGVTSAKSEQRYTVCGGAADNAKLAGALDASQGKLNEAMPELAKLQAGIAANRQKLRQQAALIDQDMSKLDNPTSRNLTELEGRSDAATNATKKAREKFLAEKASLDEQIKQTEDLARHVQSTLSKLTQQQTASSTLDSQLAAQKTAAQAQTSMLEKMSQSLKQTTIKVKSDRSQLHANTVITLGHVANGTPGSHGEHDGNGRGISKDVLASERDLNAIAATDTLMQKMLVVAGICFLLLISALACKMRRMRAHEVVREDQVFVALGTD